MSKTKKLTRLRKAAMFTVCVYCGHKTPSRYPGDVNRERPSLLTSWSARKGQRRSGEAGMSMAIREWMAVNKITPEKLYEAWQERDHFKAAYARTLMEHSKTLSHAAQLCEERDEAVRKVAKLQAALEEQHERLNSEVYEARAKLAAAEAHVATLRAALEPYHIVFPEAGVVDGANGIIWDEDADNLMDHGEYLVRVGEIAAAALAATPADCAERLKAEAGRDRAVKELRQKTEEFDARAFHVGGPAEKAFMECRDACASRADEIAKEGK